VSALLLVVVGAAVGAPSRYLVDRAVGARSRGVFPWGTFVVNVVGSFVLGVVAGRVSPQWQALVGTGFCGALTTYSTFSYETLRLGEEGSLRYAVLNVAGSVLAGVTAAAAGAWLGSVLLP